MREINSERVSRHHSPKVGQVRNLPFLTACSNRCNYPSRVSSPASGENFRVKSQERQVRQSARGGCVLCQFDVIRHQTVRNSVSSLSLSLSPPFSLSPFSLSLSLFLFLSYSRAHVSSGLSDLRGTRDELDQLRCVWIRLDYVSNSCCIFVESSRVVRDSFPPSLLTLRSRLWRRNWDDDYVRDMQDHATPFTSRIFRSDR